ncbi:MAG: ATP-binding protein [Polyangia bacterium]
MAARADLRALRVRLVLLFAAILVGVLLLFGGAVYLSAVAAEAAEDEPAAEKERELAAVRRHLAVALLGALPLGLGAAAGGGFLLGRRALRVLGEVVRTANALSLERLDQRIPVDTGAGLEVEELVRSLNAMLDRIERAAQGLRRFTADAAHELRTPLAALASEIEICLRRPREAPQLREVLGSTLEGLGRLSHLVEALLTLARSDAGALPCSPVACCPHALVAQLAEPYTAVADERGLRLVVEDVEAADGARPDEAAAPSFQTDPLLLGRTLANLLDNACKFCAPGGSVRVRVERRREPDTLVITLHDSGPAPSAEELARAGERFYRGAAHRGSTPGFGLGLSLCREFMAALGGTLHLRRSEEGGTEARLTLPWRGPAARSARDAD